MAAGYLALDLINLEERVQMQQLKQETRLLRDTHNQFHLPTNDFIRLSKELVPEAALQVLAEESQAAEGIPPPEPSAVPDFMMDRRTLRRALEEEERVIEEPMESPEEREERLNAIYPEAGTTPAARVQNRGSSLSAQLETSREQFARLMERQVECMEAHTRGLEKLVQCAERITDLWQQSMEHHRHHTSALTQMIEQQTAITNAMLNVLHRMIGELV